tara:strand:- start:52518 stop:52715 length:198 start_codon:yes stop_codon:yes gene_type:complete
MDQKTEIPGIYKAGEGILINKDNTALEKYRLRRAKEVKINLYEERLDNMESSINEIKELLRGLVK